MRDAMTPLESVFMLHIDDKIGHTSMEKVIKKLLLMLLASVSPFSFPLLPPSSLLSLSFSLFLPLCSLSLFSDYK